MPGDLVLYKSIDTARNELSSWSFGTTRYATASFEFESWLIGHTSSKSQFIETLQWNETFGEKSKNAYQQSKRKICTDTAHPVAIIPTEIPF